MAIACGACGHRNRTGAPTCAKCGRALGAPDETTETLSLDEIAAEADDVAFDRAQFPPEAGLLVVKRGPKAGSRYALDRDVITAGRDPASDIFLDDVTVSRRHVEIHRSGNRYVARDLGSLNGTYINSKPIDEAELRDGDELRIGMFKLVFFHGTRARS